MSDRLAVSASLSVLMMSIYVLFGSTEAARLPLEPEQFRAPASMTAPGPLREPSQFPHFAD